MNSLITACLTLIGGVILLVVSQIITRFLADPLVEFRRLRSEISYTLTFYANVVFNPVAETTTIAEAEGAIASRKTVLKLQDARKQFRELASRLLPAASAVLFYDFMARNKFVPTLDDVKTAAGQLIGLSNTNETTTIDETKKRYDEIARLLNIIVK